MPSNSFKTVMGGRGTKMAGDNCIAAQSIGEESATYKKSIVYNPFKMIDREIRLKREVWDTYRNFFYPGRF